MTIDRWPSHEIRPRQRIILDNDYAGDADGLFQLAHHVLSPDAEITQIIVSPQQLFPWEDLTADLVTKGVAITSEVLALAKRTNIPVIKGSNQKLVDRNTPIDNEAARAIVAEAMRTDSEVPLYVACGAGLTAIASAWLLEPAIAQKLTVVWIGGHEYLGGPPPGGTDMEYNLGIDPIAGQVVFNDSNLNIWQVPRDVYRTVIASRAELKERVLCKGPLGEYLYNSLTEIFEQGKQWGRSFGEVYTLGDSPLVLLTALQTGFRQDPASSPSTWVPCPNINDQGLYEENPNGRPIRVFKQLDTRLMLEDFYAKLSLFARNDS